MSLFQTLGDLIRKLTEEGVDLDEVGITESDLWFKSDDLDDDDPDDGD